MAGKPTVVHAAIATAAITAVAVGDPAAAQPGGLASALPWRLDPGRGGGAASPDRLASDRQASPLVPAARMLGDGGGPILTARIRRDGWYGREKRLAIDGGGYDLSLSLARYKIRRPAMEDDWRDDGVRGSAWSLAIRPAIGVGLRDSIGLLGSARLQRFRFHTPIDEGRRDGSTQQALDIVWNHGGWLGIAAGWQRSTGPSRRGFLDRAIELAAGERLAGQGPRIGVTLSPFAGREGSGARIDLTASDLALDGRDALALGLPGGHDRRLLLSLSTAF
jgi:hypothetical protein